MSKGIQCRIGYGVMTMQAAIDAGINGMAALLIAESFGDHMEEKFPEGGVIFDCLQDHKKRPIWVIVTHEPPTIVEIGEPGKPAQVLGPVELACGLNAPLKFYDAMVTEWAPCIRPAGHRGLCRAADPEE